MKIFTILALFFSFESKALDDQVENYHIHALSSINSIGQQICYQILFSQDIKLISNEFYTPSYRIKNLRTWSRDLKYQINFSYYYFNTLCKHPSGKQLNFLFSSLIDEYGQRKKESFDFRNTGIQIKNLLTHFNATQFDRKMLSCAILEKSQHNNKSLLETLEGFEQISPGTEEQLIKELKENLTQYPIFNYKQDCPKRYNEN